VTATRATETFASAAPVRAVRRVADVLVLQPWIVTAALCGVTLALSVYGPDYPAQIYRATLFRHHGPLIWNDQWYGGHPLLGYSTLFPPMAAAIGARSVGALACIGSTVALTRLLRPRGGRDYAFALLWFAVVTVGDLVIGRLPFALGLWLGLLAMLAVARRRPWLAALGALLCSLASPLAGAFLLLAATAWTASVSIRRVLPLASACTGLFVSATLDGGGIFPFPLDSLLAVLAFVALGLLLVPRRFAAVRRGLLLYGVAAVLLFAVPNPVGGNVSRLGVVAAGPLAALTLFPLGRRRALALLAVPVLVWQLSPVRDAVANSDDPSAGQKYYAGLLGFLRAQGRPQGRLEITFTRGHWESAFVAPSYPLARGWQRQLDVAYNRVLYEPDLTAATYHDWLLDTGVAFVALPDVPLDSSARREAAILRRGQPWLLPAWSDSHWRVWRVADARGLVRGDAHLRRLGIASFALSMRPPGRAVVLVRYSRLWRVTGGTACLSPTPDGWTAVTAQAPGRVTAATKLSVAGIAGVGSGETCHVDPHDRR
jgi:hypothetical protein